MGFGCLLLFVLLVLLHCWLGDEKHAACRKSSIPRSLLLGTQPNPKYRNWESRLVK